MADPKYMLFTHQPTCITVKSDGQIDGKPNDASNVLSKLDGGCFVYTVSAELGMRLKHSRAWEILEIQNIGPSALEVHVLPLGSTALADIKKILDVPVGERMIETRQFGAHEEVAFKTVGGATEFRIYVREYMAGNE